MSSRGTNFAWLHLHFVSVMRRESIGIPAFPVSCGKRLKFITMTAVVSHSSVVSKLIMLKLLAKWWARVGSVSFAGELDDM